VVENKGVKKYIERSLTPDSRALDICFTDSEYDLADLRIEFYALDYISYFEATDDDLVRDFEDVDLIEFAAWEPEWFDDDDPEGDLELNWDSDDDLEGKKHFEMHT